MKFDEFDLDDGLRKGIADAGYVECTEVQEKVLQKFAHEKCDLYVQSQTGTGKTAAYLIPILNECLKNPSAAREKALIMLPTRELAAQVEEEAKALCAHTGLKCASFFGGVDYERQTKSLKSGVDILIGTPGRVIDLKKSGAMNLSQIAFLVVDEADRMFDMGFYPDLRELIKFLPPSENRRTMLFSATLNTYVKNLAWEYTSDAQEITIEGESVTVSEIDQTLFHVSSGDKMRLLLGIIKAENPESMIIFCNTKKTCEIVSKRLSINGIKNEFIIGDLPQKKRLNIISDFKAKKLNVLCATDVAARGIDVNDLAMVINYDLPNEIENYVHRIGRTARAGKRGKACTLCSERDVYDLPAIEKYIEMKIPAQVAFESQMADDASRDVFIKLDSDERDERHERDDRRRGSRSDRRTKERAKDSAKAQDIAPKGQSKIDAKALEGMSFEERMAAYKKAYSPKAKHQRQKEGKKTKNSQAKVKPQQRRHESAAKKPNAPQKQAKKGFFARLLSFFKK